jgi:hypothetical protein
MGLALEAVALEELVARRAAVVAGLVGTFTTRTWSGAFAGTVVVVVIFIVVVVVVRVTVVDVAGTVVVLVDTDDAWRRGAEPDEVVNVKTRTSNRIGLDKITQCVLLRGWKGRILVLAG